MHVQVLKRYRDRDTKIIHEVGELVEYDNIPRIVALSRGGYVEPLEPLPAEADTTSVHTIQPDPRLTVEALDAIKARYNLPSNSLECTVNASDLITHVQRAGSEGKEGEVTIPDSDLSPEGTATDTPVVTDGFSQVVNSTTSTMEPVAEELTTVRNELPPATDPTGKKKGGKPASAKAPAKKPSKEK